MRSTSTPASSAPATRFRGPRRVALAIATMTAIVIGPAALASAASPFTADAASRSVAVPTPAAQTDDPVVTTSTLPVDNRELGNSLPKPNRGAAPQSAGDPGGWLQTSLFFLICGGVVLIAVAVWRISRRARLRRTAAGLDPVQLARARGKGVRRTPDHSTSDAS